MTLPLVTTTVTIKRLAEGADEDFYSDDDTYTTFKSNWPANITSPSGIERFLSGQQNERTMRLICEPIDLQDTDRIVNDSTGEEYEVQFWVRRSELGLDHTVADLRRVTGVAG